jgi:hypothetical protein
LAGRAQEQAEFRKLLKQSTILENLVLTGLRGVGKTVLLEHLKPIAIQEGWLWVGTDLSEAASISEASLADRLLTDLSVVTRAIQIGEMEGRAPGFGAKATNEPLMLTYERLLAIYAATPGLTSDKLKAVLLTIAPIVKATGKKGVIFAYDEAQNLSDHAGRDQFPLSLLLEVFQSIQRQDIPFMLALVGLPTLFPKLVEARTYAERMFRVVFLKKLSHDETRDAITKPIAASNCPVKFNEPEINLVYTHSGGYPYFIQFMCREIYDSFLQRMEQGISPTVPFDEIIRKLDNDFFAGRWARVTDRQQQLLFVIASLENAEREFTIQEITTLSNKLLEKPFSRSHVSQMVTSLISAGLVYKDRHGKYLFAVPLMGDFIRRAMDEEFINA